MTEFKTKDTKQHIISQYENDIMLPLKIIEYLDLINSIAEFCAESLYVTSREYDEYFQWVNRLSYLIDGYNLLKDNTIKLVKKDKIRKNTCDNNNTEIYTYKIIEEK